MAYRGIVSAAVVLLGLTGQAAFAQSTDTPAEFPPASFTGNQYVDSNGCAFIRAGIGGAVNWVPRVDRRRNQLCSFQPTLAKVAPTSAPTPVPALTRAAVATPAPVITVAPRPARTAGAPIRTVASVATRPSIVQIPNASTATARSPRIVTQAAPVIAVAPVAAPAPAHLQKLAAFCVGRTGLQPGFVSNRTGDTIDCGGAPKPAAQVASAPVVEAAPAPARQTRAAFCVGRTGAQPGFVSSTTGETINCGGTTPAPILAAAAAPRTVTLAQICADISATGRRYMIAATGFPVRCGPQTQTISSTIARSSMPSGAFVPTAPVVTPRAASCPSTNLTVDGNVVRCGPQTQPVATQVTRSAPATSSFFDFLKAPVVPASNPVGRSQREVVKPPAGYTRVWNDGRHNPNRGLPKATLTQAQPAAALQARVSSRNVAPKVTTATTHRFVQVGTFSNAANAQRLGQQFMASGLPVGIADRTRNGAAYKIVMIGPFGSANELNRGLRAARGAGFSDAYTRN